MRRSQARLTGEEPAADADPAAEGSQSPPSPPGGPVTDGWQRFRRSLLHPGRGQVIAAVMLFLGAPAEAAIFGRGI